MIVKGETRPSFAYSRGLIVLFVVVIILLIGFLLKKPTTQTYPEYFCDAEEVSDKFFIKNGIFFLNGETRSKEQALSGEYSSRVLKMQEYGIGYILNNPSGGDEWEVSVWKLKNKGLGKLVVSSNFGWYKAFVASPEKAEEDRDNWEQIRFTFRIPMDKENTQIKFYVLNDNESPAFFDDFRLKKIKKQETLERELPEGIQNLELKLPKKAWDKLSSVRERALKRRILKQGEDDWVKGKLITNEGDFEIKTRLKGDWADHLLGDKWSFRIQMKKGKSWNRLITFSLQNPQTRHHLDEWVFHRMLGREDVLSPRYDLVKLKVNGQDWGIYVFEEHFVKQLPEYNYRREGPIVKFSETAFWEVHEENLDRDVVLQDVIPSPFMAEVEPFKTGKTLGDSNLFAQFKTAQSLLNQYRDGSRPADEIFDLSKLAKYMAIMDVNRAYHGFTWHNQRYYYNPIKSLLEPIGYDGFTAEGEMDWIKVPFIGYGRNMDHLSPDHDFRVFENLFRSEEFVKKYVEYLNQFSNADYINQFIKENISAMKLREDFLQTEFHDYKYDYNRLSKNTSKLHSLIRPIQGNAVKCFYGGMVEGKHSYQLTNYHYLPVIVLGFGNGSNEKDPIFLNAFDQKFPASFKQIESTNYSGKVYFSVPGIDSVYSETIIPYPISGSKASRQSFFDKWASQKPDFVIENADSYIIPKGSHSLSFPLIVPENKILKISAGTNIDLVNNGCIMTRNAIYLQGERDNPITIGSSDNSGMGIIILESQKKSILRYVKVNGMRAFQYKDWKHTGLISVNESDIELSYVEISNNNSEDALNLVRSSFEINNLLISNTFSDGFDADFCVGEIKNSLFIRTGNDGMDFSGSKISAKNVEIRNPGDKGVSVGEESSFEGRDLFISGAKMGVVSKDLSEVHLWNCNLENVKTAFSAYQKKPEYGPAKISVTDTKVSGSSFLHQIEEGSEFYLQGNTVK